MIFRGLVCLLIGLMGCVERPWEIHPLDIRDSSVVSGPVPSTHVSRHFVVSHPPSIDSLVRVALEYSKSLAGEYPTFDIWVEYSFYRETPFTPRDFRESTGRNGGIDVHGEDVLLDIVHTRSAANECWFVDLPGESAPSKYSRCTAIARPDEPGGPPPARP